MKTELDHAQRCAEGLALNGEDIVRFVARGVLNHVGLVDAEAMRSLIDGKTRLTDDDRAEINATRMQHVLDFLCVSTTEYVARLAYQMVTGESDEVIAGYVSRSDPDQTWCAMRQQLAHITVHGPSNS